MSTLFDLTGRAAVITGGNGGIGLGIAQGLAEAGANILIVGRMLHVFREHFQWVVLDLPPLLGSPEVAAVAGRADWHIMVGRHRKTTVAELRKARDLIGAEQKTGFVMTADASRVPTWIKRRL